MYKEEVRYPKCTPLEEFRYYSLLALAVVLTSLLSSILAQMGLKHMDFLAFAVLALLAAVVLYQRIFYYRYEIIGGDLILTRLYGGHEKPMVTLGIDEIEEMGEYVQGQGLPTQRCCVWTKRLTKKQIVYVKDGKRRRLVFQPSDGMVDRLRDAICATGKERET